MIENWAQISFYKRICGAHSQSVCGYTKKNAILGLPSGKKIARQRRQRRIESQSTPDKRHACTIKYRFVKVSTFNSPLNSSYLSSVHFSKSILLYRVNKIKHVQFIQFRKGTVSLRGAFCRVTLRKSEKSIGDPSEKKSIRRGAPSKNLIHRGGVWILNVTPAHVLQV